MSATTLRRRRSERGAASVEAAITVTTILAPLLIGALFWGNWFWQAQRVDPLASGVPLDGIVGTFSCEQLVDAVKTTVVSNLNSNPVVVQASDPVTGDPLQLDVTDVAVEVVKVLPTVGAYVSVSVSLPAVDNLAGLVPLPDGGALVSEATYRLNNVVVTSESCR